MAETYNVYRDGNKIESGLTEKTYTDTALTPETTYEYHVTAENEHGESDPSNTVEVTTDESEDPPEEPDGLSVTGQTDTTADLEWK